jgi:hypothetical protein
LAGYPVIFSIRYLTGYRYPAIQIRDAPDIRPDNPAFFDIRYPAGYQIALPDIRPDIR